MTCCRVGPSRPGSCLHVGSSRGEERAWRHGWQRRRRCVVAAAAGCRRGRPRECPAPGVGPSLAGTSSGRCREGGPARRAGGAGGEQAQRVVAHHVAAPGPSDGPPGGPTAARIAPERSGCRACAAAAGPARCRCLLDAVQHCWRRLELPYAGKPIAPTPVRAAALACRCARWWCFRL